MTMTTTIPQNPPLASGGFVQGFTATRYSISEDFIRGAEAALRNEWGTPLPEGALSFLRETITAEIFRQREGEPRD